MKNKPNTSHIFFYFLWIIQEFRFSLSPWPSTHCGTPWDRYKEERRSNQNIFRKSFLNQIFNSKNHQNNNLFAFSSKKKKLVSGSTWGHFENCERSRQLSITIFWISPLYGYLRCTETLQSFEINQFFFLAAAPFLFIQNTTDTTNKTCHLRTISLKLHNWREICRIIYFQSVDFFWIVSRLKCSYDRK